MQNIAGPPRGRMEKPRLTGRQVLIVDDEPDFAASLQDLLAVVGCLAETAASAADLPSVPFDFDAEVILLDVRLKQANGIELMNQLQKRWPYARVIVITGFASKETAIQALRNGAVGYLEKPIHPDELKATIAQALWAYDAEMTMLRTQEQLQVSLNKAETANLSKSVFLANMSHELRTPLNAIIGFSEVMKHEHLGPLSADRYMSYVENIHESGQHVLSIVNDVLELSRIEMNAKELDVRPMCLDEVVKESCSMVSETAESRNISLWQVVPPEYSSLRADRKMVKQMLISLLCNAIKFTDDGGRVGVEVSCNDTGELLIAVEDNGVGIAADMIDRVFEPFAIAEPVESRRGGGVGLGLAITKQLLEHHGGRLELRSKRNVGTTATLVFPAASVGRAGCALGADAAASGG